MATDCTTTVHEAIKAYGKDRGRLMDIVRAVHAKSGYVSTEAMGEIHKALGIHLAEVRDMVSFYAFFSRAPSGRYVIRLCDSVVDRMQDAEAVGAALEETLGIPIGETTADGMFHLEHTSCIGMSDQAPSALINGLPLTHLCAGDVAGLIAALRAGQEIAKLPQAEVALNLRQRGPVIFAPMEIGAAIRKTVDLKPEAIITQMNKARIRGRGGAGFPLAMKWDFCRKSKGNTRYIICNADEGEPGTFKDRVLLTECPDLVFEGMTVAAHVLGAVEGILYLRGEYEYLWPKLEQTLAKRRRLGVLGDHICGREGFNFDIRIQLGAGAYICGEESALIESLEGKRGAPRDRPPFPVQKGYKNEPTVVNNAETLCCAARVMEMGAEWFSNLGTKDSTGTKLLSVSGDCNHPGVYEVEYGITMDGLLELVGATRTQAVQVGGPSGQCVAPKDFGRRISFEDLPTGGSIIVFNEDRDLIACMAQFVAFFAEESCGWCAPCRIGTTLLGKLLDKILAGKGTWSDLQQLEVLSNTVKTMSRCGLGQTAANPVLSTLKNFSRVYEARVNNTDFIPRVDLTKALQAGAEAADRTWEAAHHG